MPLIGDLIGFTDKWNDIFSNESIEAYGIIYNITTLAELQDKHYNNDDWINSTLCYPLTMDPYESEEAIIYYVHWFTCNNYISETYKLINHEWFIQDLFQVISENHTIY